MRLKIPFAIAVPTWQAELVMMAIGHGALI